MSDSQIHRNLNTYRYEFLLIALILLIFDKIFVPDHDFYVRYVWFANMLLIAVASYGVFSQHNRPIQFLRNLFGIISISMPFLFIWFNTNNTFLIILSLFSLYIMPLYLV